MTTVVERTESNVASPEGEPLDDIITIASEIASRDMGAEGPPPPPPSQRELRENWGHLTDDMKMSPGGLPMPAESPPVPQSIIDRNSAKPESTKKGFFDRFSRSEKSAAELPPLQQQAMEIQTTIAPEDTGETVSPSDVLNVDDSSEKARAAILAKIDAAIAFLSENQSDEEKSKTAKQFSELKDWLPNPSSFRTAEEYVNLLKESAAHAREQLTQLDLTPAYGATRNETRAGVDTIPERAAIRLKLLSNVTSAKWVVDQYLPAIAKPKEVFPEPPRPAPRSESQDAFPASPPPPPRRS